MPEQLLRGDSIARFSDAHVRSMCREGVRCANEKIVRPIPHNAENTGQFERTLIIAEKGQATSATSKAGTGADAR